MTRGEFSQFFFQKVILHNSCRSVFRYQAVLMRQRFEENRNINDMRIAKDLVARGEEELWKTQHWNPRKCKHFCEKQFFQYCKF